MKPTPNLPKLPTQGEIARAIRRFSGGVTLTAAESKRLRRILAAARDIAESDGYPRIRAAIVAFQSRMDKAGAP